MCVCVCVFTTYIVLLLVSTVLRALQSTGNQLVVIIGTTTQHDQPHVAVVMLLT